MQYTDDQPAFASQQPQINSSGIKPESIPKLQNALHLSKHYASKGLVKVSYLRWSPFAKTSAGLFRCVFPTVFFLLLKGENWRREQFLPKVALTLGSSCCSVSLPEAAHAQGTLHLYRQSCPPLLHVSLLMPI